MCVYLVFDAHLALRLDVLLGLLALVDDGPECLPHLLPAALPRDDVTHRQLCPQAAEHRLEQLFEHALAAALVHQLLLQALPVKVGDKCRCREFLWHRKGLYIAARGDLGF